MSTRTDTTNRAPIVVIGTGAAGLATALRLADAHVPVVLVSKGTLGDGSTAWAQGGLAAVTAEGRVAGDSQAAHVEDTLVAGAGLCDEPAVGELVSGAPGAIDRLARLGARFDTDPGGGLALGLEGGHHARRIIHSGGDASGAEVARVLATAVHTAATQGRIAVREGTWAVDALMAPGAGSPERRVAGVRLLTADGTTVDQPASAVVLATGGIGQLWSTTTNPTSATGDGLALAVRAGANVRDMEFMQFHPTILVVDPAHRRPGDRGVLISEAVRGEGAVIIDDSGRRVLAGVHPLADLAPRDVVSAAMQAHLDEHRLDHLFLDGTSLSARQWQTHFPTIAAMCRDRGVDPATEPIPVRPAAHYHCGGVVADLDGRTDLPGLFAVGEVACTGVQGANRLASNSLTEALVAGDRCGALLAGAELLPVAQQLEAPTGHRWLDAANRPALTGAATRFAGVLRDSAGLDRFAALLDGLSPAPGAIGPDEIETTNLHTVATLLATAASTRTESRGCHRRSDHALTDPAWRRHLTLNWSATGPPREVAA